MTSRVVVLAVVAASAAMFVGLFVAGLEGGPGIEDTPVYRTYGERITSGDVPYRDFAVEYPPGSVDPVHTHHAQALVYVLEGSIVMQVRGGAPVTLSPGQTFYEGPDDVHIVGRNASDTLPARFLVFLVKGKGAPILTPVK